MTFDELVAAVARNVYPDKIPRVLVPQFRDRVRDALILLQRKVKQLRMKNIQIVRQESSYYRCGLSIFTAPRGYVTRVAIQHRAASGCAGANGMQVGKDEMQALRDTCKCSALPVPVNTTPIPPFNFYVPDPSIDRINPITYRKVSMFDGLIWWFPWFNSNEEIIVEWNGEKKSWDGTDILPLSFLDEAGQIDREVQNLIELYVLGMRNLIGTCEPNPVAAQLFDKALVSYAISRKQMDDADLEKPYEFACKPYRSPALATVGPGQWDSPIISCGDVPRWDPPVIDSEDTPDPITPTASTPVITPNVFTFTGSMLVTITSGTPAPAEIRYTIDGSAPGPGSLLYLAPFIISGTTRVRAVSIKAGYLTSAEADRTYTHLVLVTSPILFAPSDGNFAGSVVVTLSTATPSPYQIKFTIDGSDPSVSGILYTSPFTLTISKLVRAIAVKSGYMSGPISEKQYTKIVVPKCAPVIFTPPTTAFVETLNVVLTCATPGSSIYFTIDGSTPTVDPAKLYVGAINLTSTKTIKAIAVAPAFSNSDMTQETYTYMAKTAPVVYTPTGGTFIGTQSVALSCATGGSVIHYTTNGATPTALSPTYSAPIALTATTTIKAIAITSGYGDSDIGSEVYTLVVPVVATPVISPSDSGFNVSASVTITCATSGATIRYTTNGTDPDGSSSEYSGAITVTADTDVRARAFKLYYTQSAVAQKSYVKRIPTNILIEWTSPQSVAWTDIYLSNLAHLTVPLNPGDTHVDVYADGLASQLNITRDGWSADIGSLPPGTGTAMQYHALIGTSGDTGTGQYLMTVPGGTGAIYFDGYFNAGGAGGGSISFDVYHY